MVRVARVTLPLVARLHRDVPGLVDLQQRAARRGRLRIAADAARVNHLVGRILEHDIERPTRIGTFEGEPAVEPCIAGLRQFRDRWCRCCGKSK